MFMELKEKEQKLLDLLTAVPPDFSAAEPLLREETYTPAEITRVTLEYAEECQCEAGEFAWQHGIPHSAEVMPALHSTYIVEVIRFLLPYGLEPNGIYDGWNIMHRVAFLDNECLGADALGLLLEQGGNPDLTMPDREETVFETIDFDVFFGALEQDDRVRYAAWVHAWLVMIGYGAHIREDRIEVFKEYDSEQYFDLKKLKNHRDYYFGVTHFENHCFISVFDKKTLMEVARIR